MTLFELLYESREGEQLENFQHFLREKNKELINLIFEIIFEKRKNKNLVKRAEKIKKEIEKEYKNNLENLQSLNEKISDEISGFLRKQGIGYISIESRVKNLKSLTEKVFRSVVGSFYDPYKQNRLNDLMAYRIITEDNKNTLEVLEKVYKEVIKSILPLEFYYKETTPINLSLNGKDFPIDVVSFDNLKKEHKLILYRFLNINKSDYRIFERIFQNKFKQKKAENSEINNLTKKVYVINHPLAREAIFFYDMKESKLYLFLNTSFTKENSYRNFYNLIKLIKKEGFESINKLSLGKNYIGRIPYGLFKIDYLQFFKNLGFKLKDIKPYHLKSLEEKLKLGGKGFIGKMEICLYNTLSSVPFIELQVLDYNTHSYRERSGFYNHKKYEERRIKNINKYMKKISKDYSLENKQKKLLEEIKSLFIPNNI